MSSALQPILVHCGPRLFSTTSERMLTKLVIGVSVVHASLTATTTSPNSIVNPLLGTEPKPFSVSSLASSSARYYNDDNNIAEKGKDAVIGHLNLNKQTSDPVITPQSTPRQLQKKRMRSSLGSSQEGLTGTTPILYDRDQPIDFSSLPLVLLYSPVGRIIMDAALDQHSSHFIHVSNPLDLTSIQLSSFLSSLDLLGNGMSENCFVAVRVIVSDRDGPEPRFRAQLEQWLVSAGSSDEDDSSSSKCLSRACANIAIEGVQQKFLFGRGYDSWQYLGAHCDVLVLLNDKRD